MCFVCGKLFFRFAYYICTYRMNQNRNIVQSCLIPFRRLLVSKPIQAFFFCHHVNDQLIYGIEIHFGPCRMFRTRIEYRYNSTFTIDLRFTAFSIKTNNFTKSSSPSQFSLYRSIRQIEFSNLFFAKRISSNRYPDQLQRRRKKGTHNCWFCDFTSSSGHIFAQRFPFHIFFHSIYMQNPFEFWCEHTKPYFRQSIRSIDKFLGAHSECNSLHNELLS